MIPSSGTTSATASFSSPALFLSAAVLHSMVIFAVLPVKSTWFADLSFPVFDVPPVPPEQPASIAMQTMRMATSNLMLILFNLLLFELFSKLDMPIFSVSFSKIMYHI